jgi:hypothetical protein
MAASMERVLLLPSLVKYMDLETLKALILVSKESHKQCLQFDEVGYWAAVCTAFAVAKGLYMPPTDSVKNARKFFFEELWVARHKWAPLPDAEDPDSGDQQQQVPARFTEFKIRVGCRFRPGTRGQGNMCLPLHQFLRVKREAKAAAEAAAAAKGEGGKDSVPPVLIGETDPAEFLDPFLGTLMREPVLLESSGQVRTCVYSNRDAFALALLLTSAAFSPVRPSDLRPRARRAVHLARREGPFQRAAAHAGHAAAAAGPGGAHRRVPAEEGRRRRERGRGGGQVAHRGRCR